MTHHRSHGSPAHGVFAVWLASVALAGCQFGTSLDQFSTGNTADGAVHDTAAAETGSEEPADGSVNDTGTAETGSEGGTPTCDGNKRCNGSTLEQACTDGTWQKVEDCVGEKPACNPDTLACEKVFETVWQVEDSDKTVTLPYFDDGTGSAKCDFQVLWGDEDPAGDFSKATKVTDCADAAKITHEYAEAGEKTIKILGTYIGWGTGGGGVDCANSVLSKLKRVESFGPVGITAGAFACTDGVEFAEGDKPNPEKWTNAKGMFRKAKGISEKISLWDTSNVTDMSFMFYNVKEFNQEIGDWNTANVTTMQAMFEGASSFNQPINDWKTENVTNMQTMFARAAAFNKPVSKWNTKNVTTMEAMFADATTFDQSLVAWTLDGSVKLDQIFKDSGLSKDNYCDLANRDPWNKYHTDDNLGKSFTCGP